MSEIVKLQWLKMTESRDKQRRSEWSCWGPLRRTGGSRRNRPPSSGRRTTTTSAISRTRSSTTPSCGNWSSTGMRKSSCWGCRRSGNTRSGWRTVWITRSMTNCTPWGGPCKIALTNSKHPKTVIVMLFFFFFNEWNLKLFQLCQIYILQSIYLDYTCFYMVFVG